MANESLQRMLEINTKIEKGNLNNKSASKHRIINEKQLDNLVANFDNQVYGTSPEPVLQQEQAETYSAEKEMKFLKELDEKRKNIDESKFEGRAIPKSIVESILSNPLDLKPIIEPKMDMLEQRLNGNMPGIQASVDVMKRLEGKTSVPKEDTSSNKITENKTTQTIDYSLIKTIVENIIDEKFEKIQNNLNESVNQTVNTPPIKFMSFKDNFYFVDKNDSVYECKMVYKGKRKKRR